MNQAQAFEPEQSWSRDNLIAEQGEGAVEAFHRAFPTLQTRRYDADTNTLHLARWLLPGQRAFQLATQLAASSPPSSPPACRQLATSSPPARAETAPRYV